MKNDDLIIRHEAGDTEGRDPSELTAEQFEAAGHVRAPLLRVIRAKCMDCCCQQQTEVRKCTAVACALWPYRMGHNTLKRLAAASNPRTSEGFWRQRRGAATPLAGADETDAGR